MRKERVTCGQIDCMHQMHKITFTTQILKIGMPNSKKLFDYFTLLHTNTQLCMRRMGNDKIPTQFHAELKLLINPILKSM